MAIYVNNMTLKHSVPPLFQPPELGQLHQISGSYLTVQDRGQIRAICLDAHQAPPGRGCEVFISNLPRDILMRKLYDFMVLCGEIYEIRLLMEFSGYNRGMCYVKYYNKDAARMAALVLNTCEIQAGYCLMIKMSFDNNKLLLSMIPKHITQEQIFQEVSFCIGNGLLSVTFTDQVECNMDNSETNSVLLRYETHRQALEARKALWPGIQLWNTFILIEWAEPLDLKMARVLYFRNFPQDKTRFELFDFLKSVVNIHTIIKINVNFGIGYIVFSSDTYRQVAYKLLKDACHGLQLTTIFVTTKAAIFWGTNWNCDARSFICQDFKMEQCENVKKNIRQSDLRAPGKPIPSQEIESPIDDRRTCFDFILDNVPTFHMTPVYTEPGIYNELEAIKHVIFSFLRRRFPFMIWTVMDSGYERSSPSLVIRLMLTVNNATHAFLLVQVHPVLPTIAPIPTPSPYLSTLPRQF